MILRKSLTVAALLLLVLPLVLVIVQAVPDTADGSLHLMRVIALSEAWRVGDLWPRFSPELFYGHGAALFNYYTPLYLLPATVLHTLGMGAQSALWACLVGWAVVGTVGVYKLCLALWQNPASAFLGAACFIYAPYLIINLLWRGAAAEYTALMMLPWVLWAFLRLARHSDRHTLLTAVACYAIFIPLHNITTLLGTAALLTLCLGWAYHHQAWAPMLAAGLAALALTAFAWGPALFEINYVRVGAAGTNTSITEGFRTVGEMLTLPPPADPTQLRAPAPIALGWGQILLAVGGMAFALQARDQLTTLLSTAALMAFSVFFVLPASAPLWQNLPLIGFVGFPWRFLGLTSLMLALLAARLIWKPAYTVPTALAILMLYAMPWLYPAPEQPSPFTEDVAGIRQFEAETGWLMTMSYGEFIPQSVETLPDPQAVPLVAGRFDASPRLRTAIPPLTEADWQRKAADLYFVTPHDGGQIVLAWSAFPGWRAEADGRRVPTQATSGEGLLTLEVPANTQHLRVWYAGTPIQHIMNAVSATALLIVAVGIWQTDPSSRQKAAEWAQTRELVPITAVVIGVLLLKFIVIDPGYTPLKGERLVDGRIPNAAYPVEAVFGGELRLLGANPYAGRVPSGQTVTITTLWRAEGPPPTEDYRVFIRLMNPVGHIVTQQSNPVSLPTSEWQPDRYITEAISLPVPAYTPPGNYRLEITIYSPQAGREQNATNTAGQPLGIAVPLGEITVIRASGQPAWADAPTPLSDELAFLQLAPPLPQQAEVGQPLDYTWLWLALESPAEAASARLVWQADTGQQVAAPFKPLAVAYPSSQWQQGDIWRGIHTGYVPGSLEAGSYTVFVELEGGQRSALTTMTVTTPPRTFEPPASTTQSGTQWQAGITLAGYTLSTTPDSIQLALVWQAANVLTTDYRVFVHLVDAGGNILAQSDTRPAEGTRPTPGWAPGEFIRGEHTLPRIDQALALRVGLYDPLTGQRPLLTTGEEWLTIPLEDATLP